jgi:hypothetical protein
MENKINKRVNEVGFKGQLRICFNCGDVKIWDYPNERRCPNGKNHKWRPTKWTELTGIEKSSIDRQIAFDTKNFKHRSSVIYNGK